MIIPTYYRNDVLPEAIESALSQEYKPVEVIVVDDSGKEPQSRS
ncbi:MULTISPECIES: glycosyltransferase [unclassified Halorubrum]|nr:MULTISPECIES: glycosyltransferase [unclassified Halorubrum]